MWHQLLDYGKCVKELVQRLFATTVKTESPASEKSADWALLACFVMIRNCTYLHMGVERIFSRDVMPRRFFQGGQNVANVHFKHTKLRKQPCFCKQFDGKMSNFEIQWVPKHPFAHFRHPCISIHVSTLHNERGKDLISELLIGNQFHVKLRVHSPEICKAKLEGEKLKGWS